MKLGWMPYILGMLIVAGCSEIPDIISFDLSEVGADVACGDDAHCDVGELCVASRCVLVSDETVDIALRMIFPEARDVPVIAYREMSVGDFTMPQMQSVKVYVKYKNNWMDGNLSITHADKWAGMDDEQKGQLSVQTRNDYSIRLVPGSYHFTVFPSVGLVDMPTMYFENVEVTSETTEIIFDLDSDSNSTVAMPFISDVRMWYRILVPQNMQDEVPEIQLTVKDANSPASSGHYTLESSDSQESLTVWLPPQYGDTTRDYQIAVSQKVTPTLTIQQQLESFEMSDATPAYGEDPDAISVDIQAYESTEIRGRVMSSGATGPAGGMVTIYGTSDRLQWTSRAHDETSNDGYFIFDMPANLAPSPCEIRVVYPADSPLASQTVRTTCPFDSDTFLLNVEEKQQFWGTVVNDAGAPVDNARVVLTPEDHIGGDIELTTVADGTFEARLEARRYQVTVSAPRAYGLPPMVTTWDGRTRSEMQFVLKRGELVYGTCLSADGEPVADVRTEVYVLQNGVARRLNDTESDYTGTFRLFIPELSMLKE